ncbi:MAG: hypothetical protein EOO05_22475 [Chitinophagaceae bacterium]|nr:MAG: hypothetical protein EOO05_22475 [Chitinophagaceae bacterium]
MANAAVITADIVNSTLLEKAQEKKLYQQLETAMAAFKWEFYRGDSFQVYVKDPADALHLMLKLRMEARQYGTGFDIRASVGIGDVGGQVRKLSVSTGEAFILSGRGMDELGKLSGSRLLLRSNDGKINGTLEVIALFTDYIFRELTGKQARVLSLLLDGSTQVAAAKKIRKSQSTVNKHVQSAGWEELSKLLAIYRQLFK